MTIMVERQRKEWFCSHCKKNNSPDWVVTNHFTEQCKDPTGKIFQAKRKKNKSCRKTFDNWYNKLMAMVIKLKNDAKRPRENAKSIVVVKMKVASQNDICQKTV